MRRDDGDVPARLPARRGQVVAWRVILAVDRQLRPRDRHGHLPVRSRLRTAWARASMRSRIRRRSGLYSVTDSAAVTTAP